MRTVEIVRVLKGRKSSKGKWQARCIAHRDRSPSLIISERPDGSTGLHCFAGCNTKDILDAAGLKWTDLFPDSRIDPEFIRQIQMAEARREALREERSNLLWESRKRLHYWHRKVQVLGRSLTRWPDDNKLAAQFHRALEYERRCQSILEAL